jgi:hypothetical protein
MARDPLGSDRSEAPRRPLQEWLASGVYTLLAAVAVLLVGHFFYSQLKLQLFYSSVRQDPLFLPADWSAPLDDVFIHFDFARSAARGHPFEWSAGNGYSSGGTSLLYPFVLVPGIWLGFRGESLMHFAAIVASTSVFATLLGSRRLFRGLSPWTALFAPPLFLAVGALDWSLFSGMEVAFFLAVWAMTFIAWDDLMQREDAGARGVRALLPLALSNVVLVATRPEALVVAAAFAFGPVMAARRRHGSRRAAHVGFVLGGAPLAVIVVQAIVNRVLTGDFAAAGAIVKLEMNDPRLSFGDVVAAWFFHVRYQIGRVTGHHLGDGLLLGSLFWVLAALPLFFRKTRAQGALLWAQAVLWVLIVAFNGQVRWQNERYSMPAVAWMLLAAALGVGAIVTHRFEGAVRPRIARVGSAVGVAVILVVLGVRQAPQMRDQIWFFARASRNIHEQHVKVGRRIRREMQAVHRVLVGDAGAIPYASDVPALDIIGLGGYPGLPFARASRWGVAAAIELIQRMPAAERPDVMAIYPGWWGDMPAWFGTPVDGVSVRGNVICGGLTKMIYRTHWEALDAGERPGLLRAGESIVDDADFGDLVDEKAHDFRMTGAPGFVAMKMLSAPAPGRNAALSAFGDAPHGASVAVPDTKNARVAIWDAGRVAPPGVTVTLKVRGPDEARPTRFIIRTAPSEPAALSVRIDGTALPDVQLESGDSWQEASLDVPAALLAKKMTVSITVVKNETVLYHLWSVVGR